MPDAVHPSTEGILAEHWTLFLILLLYNCLPCLPLLLANLCEAALLQLLETILWLEAWLMPVVNQVSRTGSMAFS